MKVALAVCAAVLALNVEAMAQPLYPVQPTQEQPLIQVPDLTGRWFLTTTATNGN